MLAQDINLAEFKASEILVTVIEKLKSGEVLDFSEQCVIMVATISMASDMGVKPTQDLLLTQQNNHPIQMHPMIGKFIEAIPTSWQMHLSEFGAIACGLNTDGSERDVINESKGKPRITKTYIVRKQGSKEVKIGRSVQVDKRIRTIETQSGYQLEVLAIIPKDIENMLHKQFAEFRTVGEWFDDSKGLIAAFAAKQGGAA
jgi:hypothetical protein